MVAHEHAADQPGRIVGHRDLRPGRAADRLRDRGQSQRMVVDVGCDPLAGRPAARQAVLDAGHVARRIVAVGQGHVGWPVPGPEVASVCRLPPLS